MIRVLVVDDSPLMRRLLVGVFGAVDDFEVAQARNGVEALAQLHAFRPDVITLDIEMPELNGLACLDRIMVERPTRVIMVSALTEAGAAETLEAISLGAVDFIAKPGGAISLEIDDLAPLLIEKVRSAATARLRPAHRLTERVRSRFGRAAPMPPAKPLQMDVVPAPGQVDGVVIIGTSTGGPPALDAVLGRLPADLPWPVLVAQHMPASFTGPLARRLDEFCPLAVLEVAQPMPIAPGHIYIARGDADLVMVRRVSGLVALAAPSKPEYTWHPSVDRLVDSVMQYVPANRVIGVLMTGMGSDGASAMTRLFQAGGRTIAEAEETAVVWGMPGELVRAGGAGWVARLDDIADRVIDLVGAR